MNFRGMIFDVDGALVDSSHERDFEQGKPHPEIFLTAAEELGTPPRRASWSRTP